MAARFVMRRLRGAVGHVWCCLSTENYRLQSAYEKNLIIKMVLVSGFSSSLSSFVCFKPSVTPDFSVLQFQFVNSYLSLFYIGFYLKDMERLKEVRSVLRSS